ncbi:MAG: hypothetical protein DRI46_09155 [Chloroflexi bacterium]|nr:MAG: hypothetical protein DRI46_09155 [Chloroflexota bacterium]
MSVNSRIPLAVPAGRDLASVSARAIIPFEQLVLDDGGVFCWSLGDSNGQLYADEHVDRNSGIYNGTLRGSPGILAGHTSVEFTSDFHFVLLEDGGFDTAIQTFELFVSGVTTAGVLMARKNMFVLEVIDNTKIRLTIPSETVLEESTDVFDGKTHHIVIKITATTYKLYVNGVSSGALTLSGALPSPGTDLYLGRDEDDAATTFQGRIAYVCFYNVDLADADIANHILIAGYYGAVMDSSPSSYLVLNDAAAPFLDNGLSGSAPSERGTPLYQQTGPAFWNGANYCLNCNATGHVNAGPTFTTPLVISGSSFELWFKLDFAACTMFMWSDVSDNDEYMYLQWRFNEDALRFFFRDNTGVKGTSYYRLFFDISDFDPFDWHHIYIDSGGTMTSGDTKFPFVVLDGIPVLKGQIDYGTPSNRWLNSLSEADLTNIGGYRKSDSTIYYEGFIAHASAYTRRLPLAEVRGHFAAAGYTPSKMSEWVMADAGFESGVFGNGWTMLAGPAILYKSYDINGTIMYPVTGGWFVGGDNTDSGTPYELESDKIDLVNDLGYTTGEIDALQIWVRFLAMIVTATSDIGAFKVVWYDDSDVYISDGGYSFSYIPETWTRCSGGLVNAPVGARKCTVVLKGTNVDGTWKAILFDDVQMFHRKV